MTLRSSFLMVFLVLQGCSDDVGADEAESGSSSTGSDIDDATTSGAPLSDTRIRGTFVWVDDDAETLAFEASYDLLELTATPRHTCGGDDAMGFSLGVSWNPDTLAGTHDLQDLSGPQLLVAWPTADGGLRATFPVQGSVTFDRIGFEPGDIVEGTAHATLTPDPADPDARLEELTDVSFRCVIEP